MDWKDIEKELRERMGNSLAYIQDKIKKMRTGSAHSSLVSSVMVSAYGVDQELKNMASISCPDARTILIAPWDQNNIAPIEGALIKSNLGMTPLRETGRIRLRVPELTQDRRDELIKAFKKDTEKSRVEFRQIRRLMNDKVRKALKDKEISEDNAKDFERRIQEETDKHIKTINELSEKKQVELSQV